MNDSNSISNIPPSQYFPDPRQATEDGLLCFGGEVAPNMILDALVHGVFPWPVEVEQRDDDCVDDSSSANKTLDSSESSEIQERFEDDSVRTELVNATSGTLGKVGVKNDLLSLEQACSVLAWWSPDPRAIMELDEIHIPRRLLQTMRSGKFEVTFDQAFEEVMIGCATACNRIKEGTWITTEFLQGYSELFRLGFAHSAECWTIDKENNGDSDERPRRKLVGGVYGVAINGFFDGESMFSIEANASKVALFSLLLRLKEHGFKLFDLQVLNSHTKSLGGIDIPRETYLARLENALTTIARF